MSIFIGMGSVAEVVEKGKAITPGALPGQWAR
jgi:hypothetical protein